VAAVLQVAAGVAVASQKPNGAEVQSVRVSARQPNASGAQLTSAGPAQLTPAVQAAGVAQGAVLVQIAAVPVASHAPPARVAQSVVVVTKQPNAFGAQVIRFASVQLVPAVVQRSAAGIVAQGSAGIAHIGIAPVVSQRPPGAAAQSVAVMTRQPSAFGAQTLSVAAEQLRSPSVVQRLAAGRSVQGSTHAAVPLVASQTVLVAPQPVRVSTRQPSASAAHTTSVSASQLVLAVLHSVRPAQTPPSPPSSTRIPPSPASPVMPESMTPRSSSSPQPTNTARQSETATHPDTLRILILRSGACTGVILFDYRWPIKP